MIGFTQAGFAVVIIVILWFMFRVPLPVIFAAAVAGASIASIAVIADWIGRGLAGIAPLFNAIGGAFG
jgi:hypothetical protein